MAKIYDRSLITCGHSSHKAVTVSMSMFLPAMATTDHATDQRAVVTCHRLACCHGDGSDITWHLFEVNTGHLMVKVKMPLRTMTPAEEKGDMNQSAVGRFLMHFT